MNKYTCLLMGIILSGFSLSAQESVRSSSVNSVGDSLKSAVINLNEVVVTATRTDRLLKNVPIHTQVVYGSDLQKTGITSVSEAFTTFFPGIDFRNLSPSSGGSSIQMNGYGNKYLLVLMDGERVNAGDNKENVDLARLNPENIERIEVVRGASSALYGSDAIGGVINIITKKNHAPLEGSVGTQFSDYGEKHYFANVGLQKEALTSRTTFVYNTLDGWDINPEASGKTVEASHDYTLGQRLGYRFSNHFSLSGDLNYFRRIDGTSTPYMESRRYEDFSGRLKGDYRFSEGHSLEGVYYADHYISYSLDTPTPGSDTKHYDKNYKLFRLQDRLRLSDHNTLVSGLEYNHDQLFTVNGLTTPRKAETYILFAENVWDILPNLTVVGGGRFTHHSEYNNNATWQLSANYRPGAFSLRGSYGRGFRAPTLKELYLDFMVPGAPIKIIGNSALKPEKSNYFSLSSEYNHHNLNLSVIGMYNNLSNLITEVYQPTVTGRPPFVYQYQNVEKAEMLTLELLLAYRPIPQVKLSGGYTWTKPLTTQSKDAIDRFEPREHSAVLTGDYSVLKGKYRPSISLQGKFYGDDEITWTDTQGRNSRVTLQKYYNWRLTTLHRITNWVTLTAGIDNLFDYTDPRYFTSMSPGRRYFAGARFTF